MSDYVIATAGHVDHGKSALVRALTGIEPDRWQAERDRGLTIDLGFAWTRLADGYEAAFVDVPGHERFLGNMLAGLGPAPVVCFVVAADRGWQQQSSDHRDALAALQVSHGVLVISRADTVPDGPPGRERIDATIAQARTELAHTGLHDAPVVVTSAVAGTGLEQLRRSLVAQLDRVPPAPPSARVRLWVDRSFSIDGAGTVVTGTLTAGTITCGDRLILHADSRQYAVTVRDVHSRGRPLTQAGPVTRVAVNLRGISADEVRRGDVLLTPEAWPASTCIDVRRRTGQPWDKARAEVTVHVGTATATAHMRAFDERHARLTMTRNLPIVPGDLLVLRAPDSRRVRAGALVLDVDPPRLHRRGDGARRAGVLARMDGAGDVAAEVERRGVVSQEQLLRWGLIRAGVPGAASTAPAGVRVLAGWWVHEGTVQQWQQQLRHRVDQLQGSDPLTRGLSRGAARDLLALPDAALLAPIMPADLQDRDGFIQRSSAATHLGPAEEGVRELERRLRREPFRAPESQELAQLGLGTKELAAAERMGRLVRLAPGVVVLPDAHAAAIRALARVDEPFTASQAKTALGTTRRVAIPLLEQLDARGWTERLDGTRRRINRPGREK